MGERDQNITEIKVSKKIIHVWEVHLLDYEVKRKTRCMPGECSLKYPELERMLKKLLQTSLGEDHQKT